MPMVDFWGSTLSRSAWLVSSNALVPGQAQHKGATAFNFALGQVAIQHSPLLLQKV